MINKVHKYKKLSHHDTENNLFNNKSKNDLWKTKFYSYLKLQKTFNF